jgi:hypothetical protein
MMVSNGWLTMAIFMVSLWPPYAVVKSELRAIGSGREVCWDTSRELKLGTNLFAGKPKIRSRVVEDLNATCIENRAIPG